jgi:hypothetical protein
MFAISNLILLLAMAVIVVFTLAARGQFPMSDGPSSSRSDADSDLEARIANMRYLAAQAEKSGERRKKDPKLALEELQEDFVQLQVLNKKLVLTVSQTEKVDFKFVTKSAAEINKRAERLQLNLALPEAETSVARPGLQPISDSKQLKTAVTSLGWLIYWFKKNPIFREVKVIEQQPAAKARVDLEKIIDLSLHVKKSSEQMGQAKGK